ncbi:MAG: Hsp33 family molecular chaperone HslO [Clostridia bacterium]|nr:Hsp33 family molecular chaperone HslO [Clostridia bacterium]
MGKIYKTLIFDGQISLSVLDTTDVVNEAIRLHKLTPVCAAALGRTLTVTAFMASQLKGEDERLSVTINGNGAGGKIIAAADSKLNVRGAIDNPTIDLPLKANGKLDVGGVVGNSGYITVVKNLGLKEPYVGRSELVSGEIGEDFAAYYAYSEQQPTAIAVGVLIKNEKCIGAGGVIIQPLPDCTEENLVKAENLVNKFSDVSKQISETGVEGIIEKYFKGYDFNAFDVRYKCNCSDEYVRKVLITLGEKELYDAIEKDGKIEVCCQFCDKKYVYYKKDVDEFLGKQHDG